LADFTLHSEGIGQLQPKKNQLFFEYPFCRAGISQLINCFKAEVLVETVH